MNFSETMHKKLFGLAIFGLYSGLLFSQNTPALTNLSRGGALEMSIAQLLATRPAAVKMDTAMAPGEIWYDELIDDGNVTTVSYHFEKTGSQKMVGATIYFWEPVALNVARLYWGDPNGEAENTWKVANSTGKKVVVSIGDERELRFELMK